LTGFDQYCGGAQVDEHDYTTECASCARRFVAHLQVRHAHGPCAPGGPGCEGGAGAGAGAGGAGAAATRTCECLSPAVVLKELQTLLLSAGEGGGARTLLCAPGGERASAEFERLESGGAGGEAFADLLRRRQPAIFWNLVWHFLFVKVTPPPHRLLSY